MKDSQAGSGGVGRSGTWTRWLLARWSDPPTFPRPLVFQALALAIVGTLISFAVVTSTYAVAMEFEITSTWRPANARNLRVGTPENGGRGGYLFHLRLEAYPAEGSPVQSLTIRPVAARKSWSEPLRPPVVGDLIAGYLDTGRPERMVPAEAVGNRCWALAILPLLLGLTIFLFVQAVTRMTLWLRRRQDQGSSGA